MFVVWSRSRELKRSTSYPIMNWSNGYTQSWVIEDGQWVVSIPTPKGYVYGVG